MAAKKNKKTAPKFKLLQIIGSMPDDGLTAVVTCRDKFDALHALNSAGLFGSNKIDPEAAYHTPEDGAHFEYNEVVAFYNGKVVEIVTELPDDSRTLVATDIVDENGDSLFDANEQLR